MFEMGADVGADAVGEEMTGGATCGVGPPTVGATGRTTDGALDTSGRFAGTVNVGLTGVAGTTNFALAHPRL